MKDSEILSLIQERLDSGRKAELTVTGNSMAPLFKNGATHVTLEEAGRLRKYQIALYKRKNGVAVLHRYVGKSKGLLCFRGDNELYTEKDILPENVLGVARYATTNGKTVKLYGFKQSIYGTVLSLKHNTRRLYRAIKRRVTRKK